MSSGRHLKCMRSRLEKVPHCCLLKLVHPLDQSECTTSINALLCSPWMRAHDHVTNVKNCYVLHICGVPSIHVFAYRSRIMYLGQHVKYMRSHLRMLPHCCLLKLGHPFQQSACTTYSNATLFRVEWIQIPACGQYGHYDQLDTKWSQRCIG